MTNPKDDYASFHPIEPDPSRLKRRTVSSKIKIKVELVRATKVDAKGTQFAEATSSGFIDGSQTLSEGIIERMTRGSDWIAWSGVIATPNDVKCGGFSACRVEVSDQLVLSILPASSSRSPVISFCDSVPLELTPRNLFAFTGSASMMPSSDSKICYPPPPTSYSYASNPSWV